MWTVNKAIEQCSLSIFVEISNQAKSQMSLLNGKSNHLLFFSSSCMRVCEQVCVLNLKGALRKQLIGSSAGGCRSYVFPTAFSSFCFSLCVIPPYFFERQNLMSLMNCGLRLALLFVISKLTEREREIEETMQ